MQSALPSKKPNNSIQGSNGQLAGFDLFRLSKSKQSVDVCANTLREYHEQGLNFYRMGKAVFISRTELESFIRAKALTGRVAA